MHILSQSEVSSPIITEHGEIIYELLGRNFVEQTEIHSVAIVRLPAGKSSLLHYHPIAEESYYIFKGTAHIRVGEAEASVTSGHIILIPPGTPHKIRNIGEEVLEFLTVCVPAWEPENTILLE